MGSESSGDTKTPDSGGQSVPAKATAVQNVSSADSVSGWVVKRPFGKYRAGAVIADRVEINTLTANGQLARFCIRRNK